MGLQELFKGARLIETIENYSIADKKSSIQDVDDKIGCIDFFIDQDFWKKVINEPEKYWGQRLNLHRFVVSDWIARIPGLYWTRSSQVTRDDSKQDIVVKSR